MQAVHNSASSAILDLRNQIEARLLKNEDYLALKALERALAELQMAVEPKFNNLSARAEFRPSLAAGTENEQSAPAGDPTSTLAKKISEKFGMVVGQST